MQEQDYALSHAQVEQQQVSSVLRNTYGLLAMTLAFSGLVAYFAQLRISVNVTAHFANNVTGGFTRLRGV